MAQKYKDFEFEANVDFNMTDAKKAEKESILQKTYAVEYQVSSSAEEQYTFIHTATWVNSDDAIQGNNKIYLAAKESSEYFFQKARVIKPSGDIVVLKDSDIKEGVYGEGDEQRKYFYYALEGLEKGSIIESASYQKSRPNYYGNLVYLQEDISRYNQTFELICPGHLIFAFKSLNNAPEVVYDTSSTEANRWTIEIDSVERILDQPNIFEDVVKQSLVYKLDRNTGQNRGDITSYSTAAKNIYVGLHPELGKKTQKNIAKIFKELGIKDLSSEKEKIFAIENYTKSSLQIIESNYEQLEDIDFILENKAANEQGISRLQIALLKLAGIKYEVVVTSDRTELRFDPEFEAYFFLDRYLLYFPKSKLYIAPSEKYMRGRFIPDYLTHNYGLFIKGITIGELETAIGKIKFIDALPYTDSKDIMNIDVDFSENTSQPKVQIKKESTGYSALFLQPYMHLLDEEERENAEKSLGEMISDQMEVENLRVENTEENDFGSKPFIFELSSEEHAFVEKAGNDLLFKIGELIGPQVEMYQENDRQFDAESWHKGYYERTITFNIPAGYAVKNLDDLNFGHKFGEEGKENLVFESKIVEEGEKIKVHCVEYYADIICPKADFEKYKKVINAAADFNKIVLVLEKK